MSQETVKNFVSPSRYIPSDALCKVGVLRDTEYYNVLRATQLFMPSSQRYRPNELCVAWNKTCELSVRVMIAANTSGDTDSKRTLLAPVPVRSLLVNEDTECHISLLSRRA